MIGPLSVPLPFRPGYTFWSPRVRAHSETHTITHEGHEYTRREDVLQVSAKQKRITSVDITVSQSGDPCYRYWAVNADNTPNWPTLLPTLVDPHSGFASQTHAIAFARHWRDTQQCEYHGGSVDSSPDSHP